MTDPPLRTLRWRPLLKPLKQRMKPPSVSPDWKNPIITAIPASRDAFTWVAFNNLISGLDYPEGLHGIFIFLNRSFKVLMQMLDLPLSRRLNWKRTHGGNCIIIRILHVHGLRCLNAKLTYSKTQLVERYLCILISHMSKFNPFWKN
jgi:hypothetical protein